MDTRSDTEQLLCALLFLLTRQANSPGESLATPIREHFNWLLEHPDTAQQPMLRKTCRRLLQHWQNTGQQTEGDALEAVVARSSLH